MKKSLALLSLLFFNIAISQQDTTDLKEVIVSTTKLEIPFSKNFRTVKIISSDYIKNSPSTNVSDLLQEITGIDVRRRGVGGVQGDLYIRGGGFDQTLLLVDGMKMDDAQTGHHTLNMIVPLYLIERIENKTKHKINLIDKLDVDGDFIESQAFAYLTVRSYLGLPISFPETTGCKEPTTGGVIVKNF